jgi:hypothetical protein
MRSPVAATGWPVLTHASALAGDAAPATIQTRGPAAVRQPPRQSQESIPTTAGWLPRITRLLALAVRFEGLLQDGTVRDYAELARLGGVSRARITQIMSLRSLAPELAEF